MTPTRPSLPWPSADGTVGRRCSRRRTGTAPRTTTRVAAGITALVLALGGSVCVAQGLLTPWAEADLPLGEQLIRQHRCSACHAERVGGDGSAIYRPQGRIDSPPALRGMVEQCNLSLNLALFPEEVTAIAAVLQRDHYRFGPKPGSPASAPAARR